mgnify:CR=1 FL=1
MGQIYNSKKLMDDIARLQSSHDLIELLSGIQQSMAIYESGIQEVLTKLEILQRDARFSKHNPIESIKSRVKSPMSILEKMHRKGFPISLESIKTNLNDIAGIRVICPFIEDIYTVADMLTRQDDLKVLEKKDYIQNPKPNGYRSLHLIVETPIFLHDQKRLMKVEVQFRTISMDWWASLEHKIRYKKNLPEMEYVERELYECAEISAQLDARMEKLQKIAAQATEGKDRALSS